MALVHPNGILAGVNQSSTSFRLASALKMKHLGIRLNGGAYREHDYIECVRTGVQVQTVNEDGIMVAKTIGDASDLVPTHHLKQIIEGVKNGKRSPLVPVQCFLKGQCRFYNEINQKYAKVNQSKSKNSFLMKFDDPRSLSCMLMVESKLSAAELTRLYCRRFGYCDTNMLK